MKIRNITTALGASAVALLIGLTGCGGGGDGGISGTGVMRLSLTDAPACGYNEVNITIEKVRVHKSADATSDDGEDGWSDVVLTPPRRVDLLKLTNGVLEELGETELPAGRYTQMRLVLAENGGATPLANSVVPTGGTATALTTPSGQQSGLKLNVNMEVQPDQLADFVIDFDACKSVVRRGNSGQFNLKPVVSVTPVLSAAGLRVVGHVDPRIALPSTTVSVQQGGVPVKATVPAANGEFVLYPVPVGNYDLVISAAGRVTAVMTSVPVVTTSYTTLNTPGFAFLPQPSTSATVTGTVTPTSATVRALQTLTGSVTVEVASAPVDADTGDFEVALPDQAPVRTTYVPNATAYTFSAETAAARLYTLEAAYEGAVQIRNINTTALPPSIAFSFP